MQNKLGLQQAARLNYGSRGYCSYLQAEHAAAVAATEREPSLFELVEGWLERTPFLSIGDFKWWAHYRAAVDRMLEEDSRFIRANTKLTPEAQAAQLADLEATREHYASLFDEEKYTALQKRGERRLSHRALQAALLITLYQDEPGFQLPYRLLAVLQDVDEAFTTWRYRHAQMVHRMLGTKMGTGGSSGYFYLRATAERHKVFGDLANLPTFLIPRAALPPLPEPVRTALAFTFTQQLAHSGVASGSGSASAAPAPAAAPLSAPHPVPQGAAGGRCPVMHH